MVFRKYPVLAVLLAAFFGSSAHAGLRLSIAGVGGFASEAQSGGTASISTERKMGIGGGGLVEVGVTKSIGFETGALLIQRVTAAQGLSNTFQYLQIPALIRWHLGKVISIGVGGYYAMGMGTIVDSEGGGSTYADAGVSTSDMGLLTSLAVDIPIKGSFGLFLDGRYAMGMTNILPDQGDGSVTKWSDVQVVTGLRFNLSK